MKVLSSRLFWGSILIIAGVLLLLDTINIFKGGMLFWTIALAIVGVLFLSLYVSNRQHWWALIPGVILLIIAIAISLESYLPGFNALGLTGPIILGGIALSFLLVYIVERRNWWAIIPAGVMATLAVVAAVDVTTSGAGSGGIFFLGLGLTFALVAFLPTPAGQMRWAWIPAGILGVIGILILITAESLINYVWPALFILAGIFMMVRALSRRN